MAAKQQPQQQLVIRTTDLRDFIESLDNIEIEAANYGQLKSAVVEFEDYIAVFDDNEWTLQPKEGS